MTRVTEPCALVIKRWPFLPTAWLTSARLSVTALMTGLHPRPAWCCLWSAFCREGAVRRCSKAASLLRVSAAPAAQSPFSLTKAILGWQDKYCRAGKQRRKVWQVQSDTGKLPLWNAAFSSSCALVTQGEQRKKPFCLSHSHYSKKSTWNCTPGSSITLA